MRAKQPVSPARHDDLRVTLAISRETLARQRLDVLAQIRALSSRIHVTLSKPGPTLLASSIVFERMFPSCPLDGPSCPLDGLESW
jgi:hypothetical protein